MLIFGDLFLLLFLIKYRFDQEFRPIELEYIQSRIDKVANAAPGWLHAASPERDWRAASNKSVDKPVL
jgi:hypothetical protein